MKTTPFIRSLPLAAAFLLAAAPLARGKEPPAPTPEMIARIEAALPGPDEAVKPARPRHLLIFYRTEGYVHASIPTGNHAFLRLGEKTGAYTAELSDSMDVFTDESLARFDAILFLSTTHLAFENPAHRAALMKFVENGGGIVGVHAASDNFYTWEAACAMLGGQFDGHPWTAGGTWAVKLDEPEHPANAPFHGHGFWINDEIYQIKGPYSRDTHRVLLSLDMSKAANREVEGIKRTDGDFAITWLKHHGRGRIFYCSLGHNHHIFWNPAVMRHYLIGIQWVMGDRDLPSEPSATLRPPPEPALAPAQPGNP